MRYTIPFKNRKSLRKTLILSMVLIVSMTLIMGGFLFFLSKQTIREMQHLKEHEVALSIKASLVSVATTKAVTAAGYEIRAKTIEEVEEFDPKIQEALHEVQNIVTDMNELSGDEHDSTQYKDTLVDISKIHKEITEETRKLKQTKLSLLSQEKELKEKLSSIHRAYSEFTKFVMPIADDALFDVVIGKNNSDINKTSLTETLANILQLEAEGNHYFGLIESISHLEKRDQLSLQEEKWVASAYQMKTQYKNFIANNKEYKVESAPFDLDLLESEGRKIIELKKEQIQLLQKLEKATGAVQELSAALEEEIYTLIDEAGKSITFRLNSLEEQLEASNKMILLISLLCVCFAVVTAWQYIHKRVIVRMEHLNDKMVKLANGDLNMSLEENIHDEIGQMAASVEYFRQNLIKNIELHQELERSMEEMHMARNEAMQANHAKSDFLANMSHELRTPMNSIIGMVALLLDEKSIDSESRNMLEVVYRSATNLLDIVNDILDLSKIEAKSVVLEEIPFVLDDIVGNVLATLKQLASKKGLAIEEIWHCETPPFLLGDPVRLSRILTNLVGNAIKYTETGFVTVDIDVQKGEEGIHIITFSITDTGIGISAENLDIIFEKFSQADVSTTRKFGGTGLGLAITKQLIELMGGTISVQSTVGVGSVFQCKIPLQETDLSPSIDHLMDHSQDYENLFSTSRVSAENAHILIAEDHPMNQSFIKLLMKKFGLKQFTLVENGQEAIEAIHQDKYDLILMDCHMPLINGYDATREIREIERLEQSGHTPIVAMTANAMVGDKEMCMECGMDDYISKPVSPEIFKRITSRWIDFDHGEKNMIQPEKEEGIINLNIIKEISDGDQEIERELISLYIEQSDENIESLRQNCIDGESTQWVESAHKLKGGSASVGAEHLKDLCSKAQKMAASTEKERRKTLEEIEKNYQIVRAELKKIFFDT